MLDKDFAFFKEHLADFLKDHRGEYVVIKNEQVIGFYKTQDEAFRAMQDSQLGTFLVQNIKPSDQSIIEYYTQRVVFA
jgi:hypothetical protein